MKYLVMLISKKWLIGDPDQLVSGETEAGGAASGAQTPWGRPATSTGSMHDRLELILAVRVFAIDEVTKYLLVTKLKQSKIPVNKLF